jgi:hypothetical protein
VSFLSPLALLLAAAALVPLLLHLRRGRVTRVIEFPAARYLARATQEHQRALRVRNSLLLLIQVAIVALVALAAARPLARLGTGHPPAAIAIVLDNSLSSSVVAAGNSVLDDLKSAARDVIARATPEDRLWLATADATITEGNPATLNAILDTLHALAGAGNPRAALGAAANAVASVRDVSGALALLTDGQRTSWAEPVRVQRPLTIFVPLGSAAPNHAVVSVEPRPAHWSTRGMLRLAVQSQDTIGYRIVLDERTVARGAAPPDGALEATVPVIGTGWVTGRVELPHDELASDDSRWFAAWQGAPPGVDARAGPFATDAVAALTAAGTLASGSDVSIVSADEIVRRPALIVAPARAGRVGAANLALARAGIPWRLGAERRTPSAVRGPGVETTVRLRYALSPTASALTDTLARVGDEPWIVAGDGYVLVGSPLDTSATDFPVTAEFVPWLARTVADRLAPAGGPISSYPPGTRISMLRGADSLASAGPIEGAARDSITLPERAGVYFWMQGSRRIGAVVVNAEAEESDLRRESEGELRSRFAPGAVRVRGKVADFVRDVYGTTSRRPVAPVLLALALGLLVVESIMAGAGLRRTRTAPAERREAA